MTKLKDTLTLDALSSDPSSPVDGEEWYQDGSRRRVLRRRGATIPISLGAGEGRSDQGFVEFTSATFEDAFAPAQDFTVPAGHKGRWLFLFTGVAGVFGSPANPEMSISLNGTPQASSTVQLVLSTGLYVGFSTMLVADLDEGDVIKPVARRASGSGTVEVGSVNMAYMMMFPT